MIELLQKYFLLLKVILMKKKKLLFYLLLFSSSHSCIQGGIVDGTFYLIAASLKYGQESFEFVTDNLKYIPVAMGLYYAWNWYDAQQQIKKLEQNKKDLEDEFMSSNKDIPLEQRQAVMDFFKKYTTYSEQKTLKQLEVNNSKTGLQNLFQDELFKRFPICKPTSSTVAPAV